MCRDDGTFTPTTAKCAPIPCTLDDIVNIIPISGTFTTDAIDLEDPYEDQTDVVVEKDESITFTCTDEDKVPNVKGLDEVEVTCLLGGTFEWANQTIEWPSGKEGLSIVRLAF